MMRRIAAPAFSVVLLACGGTSSTADGPVSLVDAKTTSDAPATAPDAPSVTYSGTIALHSLQALDPTGTPIPGRFGDLNVEFAPQGPVIEGKSEPQPIPQGGGLTTPCGASSVNVADIPHDVNEGTVSFTINRNGGGAPTVPDCTYDAASYSYPCSAATFPELVKDGDSVQIGFHPLDTKFAPYTSSITTGSAPTLTTATTTLLTSPIDLSGTALTFAINEAVQIPTALVVVVDATDATNFASATDFPGSNATKTANLTCSTTNTSSLTVPGDLLKIVGNIHPTKLRVFVFHEGSDLTLLGTNLNVVVGQGLLQFTTAK
jgi:hypothetical protein